MRKAKRSKKANRTTLTTEGLLTSQEKPLYTLRQVLPRVVGLDNRLQHIIGKNAKATSKQIQQIAQDIGSAVLLLLCNRVFDLSGFMTLGQGEPLDKKMAEQVREYYYRMLWDTVMRAIGIPAPQKSKKQKRASIKKFQKALEKIERQVLVKRIDGKLVVDIAPHRRIYEGEEGVKVISADEIHRSKDAGLKKLSS